MGAGFAGSSVGLPAAGVPTNPFASNHPSAPPPVMVERPGPRVHRPRRLVRERPLPPGRIAR
ncbi:hypothetical protein U8607_20760 [Methylobacterium durans]|uniref:hypothetical protein n=1 Tax=Methylobacterium durans TaxID=2202825 RepID=UPI002AFE332A|nr:hypothetical protein [Methylobacterium durans]MEA1834529.1 hypothetical protein [Methylobacterium durans]